eukprot:1016330-Prymnesium_polylepis.2
MYTNLIGPSTPATRDAGDTAITNGSRARRARRPPQQSYTVHMQQVAAQQSYTTVPAIATRLFQDVSGSIAWRSVGWPALLPPTTCSGGTNRPIEPPGIAHLITLLAFAVSYVCAV